DCCTCWTCCVVARERRILSNAVSSSTCWAFSGTAPVRSPLSLTVCWPRGNASLSDLYSQRRYVLPLPVGSRLTAYSGRAKGPVCAWVGVGDWTADSGTCPDGAQLASAAEPTAFMAIVGTPADCAAEVSRGLQSLELPPPPARTMTAMIASTIRAP